MPLRSQTWRPQVAESALAHVQHGSMCQCTRDNELSFAPGPDLQIWPCAGHVPGHVSSNLHGQSWMQLRLSQTTSGTFTALKVVAWLCPPSSSPSPAKPPPAVRTVTSISDSSSLPSCTVARYQQAGLALQFVVLRCVILLLFFFLLPVAHQSFEATAARRAVGGYMGSAASWSS